MANSNLNPTPLAARHLWLSVILAWALLAQLGCNSATSPPQKGGKRDYTWTIDTIAYPGSAQTMMWNVWASGQNSAWIVGHNDQSAGTMFRFDGMSWKPARFHVAEGGPVGGVIDLATVAGFGAAEVFAVGERLFRNDTPPPNFLDSSLIARYDGTAWTEDRVVGRGITSLWVASSNDVWAGGIDWHLFHFNGSAWAMEQLPKTAPPNSYSKIYGIGGTLQIGLYALASTRGAETSLTTHYLLHRGTGGWAVIDTSVGQPPWGDSMMWVSPNGTLYSAGHGVFRWSESSWQRILTTNGELEHMLGNTDDNIFVTTYNSGVYHWNGEDWYRFDSFVNPAVGLTGGWTDGIVVFIVGHTLGSFPNETLVFRGQ